MTELYLTSTAVKKRKDGNYLPHEAHMLLPHEVIFIHYVVYILTVQLLSS